MNSNSIRPAVLLSTANRLLEARDNFAEQRVLVEMAYAVVSLYSAHLDVRDLYLFLDLFV